MTANNQPYVSAPVVLVFCMNPSRIKMNFPAHNQKVLGARRYTGNCLCPTAVTLGLTSVWIGMIDEQKAMQALVTDFVPGCILCLGYSQKMLHPAQEEAD